MKRTDFPRLVEAAQTLRRVPIFVDDTAGLTNTTMRTRAMRLKRQHDLGLIVVDYVQLMRPSGTQQRANRVQETPAITRGLQTHPNHLDVTVRAPTQPPRPGRQ